MRREFTFKVSSWVLKEFIRSSGTLLPYFLLSDCKRNDAANCHQTYKIERRSSAEVCRNNAALVSRDDVLS
jgi:hypothetical protein